MKTKNNLKIALINPNNITQKGDFFGTGIPFMPITLAYLSSFLRQQGFDIQVVDAFGEAPRRITSIPCFFVQGLLTDEIVERIRPGTQAVILYASLVITHNANLRLIRYIKKKMDAKIIVIENIHSVVGYSLLKVNQDFFDAGADYVLLGEPEERSLKLMEAIRKNKKPVMDGVIFYQKGIKKVNPIKKYNRRLDHLPYPAWDLFPIKNYWDLQYAHAPMSGHYLPLLTSRGCPNDCEFCITPALFGRRWRPRSAKNVADEIEYYIKKFKVHEFHIEDFNPTVSKERIVQFCREILKRKIKINIKIAAGTKAETIDEETIIWMKKAGFSYVSISPESGSVRMLDRMNKKFNFEHGLDIVKQMHKLGITSQACFIIGFPGEKRADLILTKKYIKKLVKAGIDEIALFIMTPIPGSRASDYSPLGYNNLSELTFSPKWRSSYIKLSYFRKWTYFYFFVWKLLYHPKKVLDHLDNIFKKNFKTKIEMALWRIIRMHIKGTLGRKL